MTDLALRTVRAPTQRQAEAALLCVVVFLASTRLLVASARNGSLYSDDSPLLYQAATLGFDYAEFGAVRRGLGGSMARLLSHDLLHATVRFHLIWAALVALAVALLYRRYTGPTSARAACAIAAVAIMLRWGEDAGRTDMAIVALFAAGALAMQSRRLDVAVALVGVGLFMHESSLIFGLPLLLALVRVHGGWRAFDPRVRRLAAAWLVACLALYGLMDTLPRASVPFMIDTVRAKFPPHRYVDWAIYFATSGSRGVRTSICQNFTDPSYWIHPFGGLVVLAVAAVALSRDLRRDAPVMALAALPGFVFLCIVANDIARWTMFGVFNLWLVGVSAPSAPSPGARWTAGWRLPAACAIGLLTHPKPDKIEFPIYAGSPAIEWAARKLHSPRTPSVDEALLRCDPGWLDSLDTSAVPAGR